MSVNQAPQQALRNLDQAFAHFFRRVEQKKQGKLTGPVGFPRFKSRRRGLGSFRLTGSIHIFKDSIQLPRLGRLRPKERGYLPTSGAHILSATVLEHAGPWFVSVQVEEEVPNPTPAKVESIGVDLGVKTLATRSDGTVYENPKALDSAQRRLRRLHYRIANVRHDALHKATSDIVAKTKPDAERPRAVVIEDLNVNRTLHNHCLARAIADVGMCEFGRQVQYKAIWNDSEVVVADRWYPSSKWCSGCGAIKNTLDLFERTYESDCCGASLDRDLNAARNLAQLATDRPNPSQVSQSTASSAGSNACGEDVRPASNGQTSMKQEPNRSPGSA